jgi:hypothetical protein
LVQLQLESAPAGGRPRLLGVLIRGLTYESERWRLATMGDWQPSGTHRPHSAVTEALQQFCRELFGLFPGALGVDQDRAA